ncbi:phosphonopyruvate decarboxylase [Tumebacillus sp. BK434]|uniref:thiamine pyrophosphate-dependent enzyme n=1 Tax=Tumebacillus sp. BK434 TaxID=2512169 RepID=UPI0010E5A7B4|nr:thiamine pyrophosphate-dependent enzyme [Tumebacillus sp. BK434]TCP59301.1 phosphonopyruvate decarboxylase [Tumebacillus sp. BK434]
MMKMTDVMQAVLNRYPDALYVSTCGYISRDFFNLRDTEDNFYLLGSMGMAAPVGLGLALTHPERTVVVFDGDGSFMMNLGAIAMVTAERPNNLVHVVLDNRMYESTGGQKPVQFENMVDVAKAAGYAHAVRLGDESDFDKLDGLEGLTFVQAMIAPRTEKIGKRIHWTPQELVARFRLAAQKG